MLFSAEVIEALERSIGQMVRREDFLELKAVMAELAQRVNELAEAQRRKPFRPSLPPSPMTGIVRVRSSTMRGIMPVCFMPILQP